MITMANERLLSLFLCLFTLWLVQVVNSSPGQPLRRICYFTNWSCDLLVKEAYFCLHDIEPSLCSHIIYAFAGINVTSRSLSSTRVDDESYGNVQGRYIKFNEMKKHHPDLKTLLSAGGSYQAEKFKNVTSTNDSRTQFAYNTARYVRKWDFDGLDLDWEYPGEMEKEALTLLIKDLKSAFKDEAKESGKQELLLSLAAPVGEERVRSGYQVDLISRDVDMINLMAYDFYYGAWDITAFNSPLYSRHHHSFSRKHSVEYIVQFWVSLGTPPHKINLGIAGYGQSFTLKLHRQEILNHSNSRPDYKSESRNLSIQSDRNFTDFSNQSTNMNSALSIFEKNTESYRNQNGHLSTSHGHQVRNVNPCDNNYDDCDFETNFSNVIFGNLKKNVSSSDKLINIETVSVSSASSESVNAAIFDSNVLQPSDASTNAILSQKHSHANTDTFKDGRSQTIDKHATMLARDDNELDKMGGTPDQRSKTLPVSGSGTPDHSGETFPESDRGTLGNRGSNVYGVGSKSVGPGRPGRLRHLKGQLSYPEICEMIQAGAAVFWDQEQMAPFIVQGDQWVGFENARSVTEKVKWAQGQHLGGVMFWSLDLDDFKGNYCAEKKYPLLSAMSDTVISLFNHDNGNTSEVKSNFTNTTHRLHDTIASNLPSHQLTTESYQTFGANNSTSIKNTVTPHLKTNRTKNNKNTKSKTKIVSLEPLLKNGPSTSRGLSLDSDLEESEVNNFYDYYIAFKADVNTSTITSSTVSSISTPGAKKADKPKTNSRKKGSSRRHIYRNTARKWAASMNIMSLLIFILLIDPGLESWHRVQRP